MDMFGFGSSTSTVPPPFRGSQFINQPNAIKNENKVVHNVDPKLVLKPLPKKISNEDKLKQVEEDVKKFYNDIKKKEEETKKLHEFIKHLDAEKEKLMFQESKRRLNNEILSVINAFTNSEKSTIDDLTNILNYVNTEFNTKIAKIVETKNNDNSIDTVEVFSEHDGIINYVTNDTSTNKRTDNPSLEENPTQKKRRENV